MQRERYLQGRVETFGEKSLSASLNQMQVPQIGTFHICYKIFNRLLAYIKDISHDNKEFELLYKILFILFFFVQGKNILDTITHTSGLII